MQAVLGPRQTDGLLCFELRQQPQRGRIARQRETPRAQAGAVVVQFQQRGASVVGEAQF